MNAEEIKKIIDALSDPSSEIITTLANSYRAAATTEVILGLVYAASALCFGIVSKRHFSKWKDDDQDSDLAVCLVFGIFSMVLFLVSCIEIEHITTVIAPEQEIFRTVFCAKR